eukprot:gene67087-91883_t
MGGGRRFLYPKWVWSPTGGWWSNHPYWKRNTAIALVVIAGLTVPIYIVSERKT